MQQDLSLAGEMEYYNGLVFSGYVAGVPRAVLKGGRYDLLAQRFTPGACALGFALYLDELERLRAPLPPVQQQGTERQGRNSALPKGRLGETYLIGANGERNNITVLRDILTVMGKSPDDFDWVKDRPGHDRRYAIDSTKLQRELGWRPAHPAFAEGLQQPIDWYVANESWWRPAKEATEARYRAQGQ